MISEFPLFVFTTCSGLAAGMYIAHAVFFRASAEAKRPWVVPVACIVLLAVGLLGTLAHLGRPERVLNALVNPSSMICQEAYWSAALGIFLLADAVLCKAKGAAPVAVRALGAAAALGLTVITGLAYFTSYGNPVWTGEVTLALFIAGDAATGFALYALFDAVARAKRPFVATVAVLCAAFAITAIVLGLRFAAFGYGIEPFAAAGILAAAATVASAIAASGNLPEKTAFPLAFALAFAAVVVARWAFYAASIL